MKTVLMLALALLPTAAIAQGAPLKFTGTTGFEVSSSPTIATAENRARFNTRMVGSALITIGNTDFPTSISCVGHDITQGGKVVEMNNLCEFSTSGSDRFYATFDASQGKFVISGGQGRWADAQGSFTAAFVEAPSITTDARWFHARLTGEIRSQ